MIFIIIFYFSLAQCPLRLYVWLLGWFLQASLKYVSFLIFFLSHAIVVRPNLDLSQSWRFVWCFCHVVFSQWFCFSSRLLNLVDTQATILLNSLIFTASSNWSLDSYLTCLCHCPSTCTLCLLSALPGLSLLLADSVFLWTWYGIWPCMEPKSMHGPNICLLLMTPRFCWCGLTINMSLFSNLQWTGINASSSLIQSSN